MQFPGSMVDAVTMLIVLHMYITYRMLTQSNLYFIEIICLCGGNTPDLIRVSKYVTNGTLHYLMLWR